MTEDKRIYERVALISEIARRKPEIGRTALMKFLYLLQVVKELDLGYRFELYSYGPFDSAVLSDITTAVGWGGAKQTVCHYPSGVGYELSVGPSYDKIKAMSEEFLDNSGDAIGWAVENFGKYGAGDMELIATMVYVDQEAHDAKETLSPEALIKRSLEIKPRYNEEQARDKFEKLKEARALFATVYV